MRYYGWQSFKSWTRNHAIYDLYKTYRSSHHRCSIKKGILKNFAKFTGNHLYQSLGKIYWKKRLWHMCFPVNFAKSLRTPFLQNTSGWLLLTNNSMYINLRYYGIAMKNSQPQINKSYKVKFHKKWNFPLRISSQFPQDLVTFTTEILNGKLHLLWNVNWKNIETKISKNNNNNKNSKQELTKHYVRSYIKFDDLPGKKVRKSSLTYKNFSFLEKALLKSFSFFR